MRGSVPLRSISAGRRSWRCSWVLFAQPWTGCRGCTCSMFGGLSTWYKSTGQLDWRRKTDRKTWSSQGTPSVGLDGIMETRSRIRCRMVHCLPPVSNCGTLMSFSTSFWSVEEFERRRLDPRYRETRNSSRVGRARDDVELGQWSMTEWASNSAHMVSHPAAVATLQNFRTLGCSRSLTCRTNPLGRQALELHIMGRAGPPSRGLDCGVPGYLHQNPGYCALSQLLSAQKKFSGRSWIDLHSFPIFPTNLIP